ncbi:DUF1501 domain-containing protein [Gimesia aquarii]|uniref:DUF1501 domain-containing protein n=1 Tax=Gimesia aquarii TaxID=2527964 RepID=A0A517WPF2_9PLAN|nr:DUF1501 domain-containing protein [Gimesia aquarii]QDU07129.1 hypothetical protein V202x_04790 [Gimesia aquarii]
MSCSANSLQITQSRRSFLQAGFLTLGGLGLGDLLRLRTAAASPAKTAPDTSIILIWLQGGPSHMETYDLKPDAPVEYRGEFNPIHTEVPGMDICEMLPLHAKVADRFTIIRSISHGFANHAGGAGRFLSGRDPLRPLDPIAQFPTIGPIVSRMRDHVNHGIPNYIGNQPRVYGGGSAYLGESALPFVVGADPNRSNFQVPNITMDEKLKNRLDDRMLLLTSFDQMRRDLDQSGSLESMDQFNRRALEMLTSDRARNAFDMTQESDATREKYGRHKWGQRALLARRLVEAGSSFVTMQMQNPSTPGSAGNWDIHAVNGHLYDDMRGRLPIFDRAVSALIEDIYERGLDEKVMVIVSGEFGRTPRINPQKGTRSKVMQPGRDHWPGAMSVLVSGGGMKMGQVIGSTTANGAYAKDNKLDPNDLLSTVYRFLGIDQNHEFLDHSGRPMPILPKGKPIVELT